MQRLRIARARRKRAGNRRPCDRCGRVVLPANRIVFSPVGGAVRRAFTRRLVVCPQCAFEVHTKEKRKWKLTKM